MFKKMSIKVKMLLGILSVLLIRQIFTNVNIWRIIFI